MKGSSLWKCTNNNSTDYPSLDTKIEADVAIIGGGITGITAAIELINAGKKVVIVEAEKIGGATTSMSTGNLYIPVQPFFKNIISHFNLETARRVAEARISAINYIEKTVKDYKIDCHFTRRNWYAVADKDKKEVFQKEMEALKQIGIEVDSVSNLPFDLAFEKACFIKNQARFNPLKYVLSLARILEKKECFMYENSLVISLEEKKTYCLITTEKGSIKAKDVFMATHTPIGINSIQLRTAPYRSYVVGAYLKSEDYPDAQIHQFTKENYTISTHAISSDKPEILLIAGNHHKTGQGKNMQQHFLKLENYLQTHFSIAEMAYHWSAQHFHSADNIPYIGLAHPKNKYIYMATGYFADGLVYGTMGGRLIADEILKKKRIYEEIFAPKRIPSLSSLPFIVKENGNVIAQYAKDLPLPFEPYFKDLQIGEGKVIEMNQEKFAISKDASNNLHIVSAVCTHMKCIVNWNNAEQTWDCPCHGSRFKCSGEVIDGPATRNLENKQNI